MGENINRELIKRCSQELIFKKISYEQLSLNPYSSQKGVIEFTKKSKMVPT